MKTKQVEKDNRKQEWKTNVAKTCHSVLGP